MLLVRDEQTSLTATCLNGGHSGLCRRRSDPGIFEPLRGEPSFDLPSARARGSLCSLLCHITSQKADLPAPHPEPDGSVLLAIRFPRLEKRAPPG